MKAISFQALTVNDLALVHQWFNLPHVQAFYSLRTWTKAQVVAKLTPYITGEKPVHAFIVYLEGTPIGYAQYYRVIDYPWPSQLLSKEIISKAAGMDLFIGEPYAIGRGLGREIIKHFLHEKIWPQFEYCVVDPDQNNAAALHCYQAITFQFLEKIKTKDAVGREAELVLFISQREKN